MNADVHGADSRESAFYFVYTMTSTEEPCDPTMIAAFEAEIPAASDLRCSPDAVAAFCCSIVAEFRQWGCFDRVTFTLDKSVSFCAQVTKLLTSKGYAVSHAPLPCPVDGAPTRIVDVGLWTTAAIPDLADAGLIIYPTASGRAGKVPPASSLQKDFLRNVATECAGIILAFEAGSTRSQLLWKHKSARFCTEVEGLMRRKGYGVKRETKDGNPTITTIRMP